MSEVNSLKLHVGEKYLLAELLYVLGSTASTLLAMQCAFWKLPLLALDITITTTKEIFRMNRSLQPYK
jgi:hypothetical protein